MTSTGSKKGEMPWWLTMMILAILFLAVLSFAGGNIIKKGLSSLGIVQEKTDNEAKCLVLFDKTNDKDGDGYLDTKECDPCDDDPTRHGPDCKKQENK